MTFDQCKEALISIVKTLPYDEARVRAISLIDEYFSANRHDITNEKGRLAIELRDAASDPSLRIVSFLLDYLVGIVK